MFVCSICDKGAEIENAVPLFDNCSDHTSVLYCWDCLSAGLLADFDILGDMWNLHAQVCLATGCEARIPVWAIRTAIGDENFALYLSLLIIAEFE